MLAQLSDFIREASLCSASIMVGTESHTGPNVEYECGLLRHIGYLYYPSFQE